MVQSSAGSLFRRGYVSDDVLLLALHAGCGWDRIAQARARLHDGVWARRCHRPPRTREGVGQESEGRYVIDVNEWTVVAIDGGWARAGGGGAARGGRRVLVAARAADRRRAVRHYYCTAPPCRGPSPSCHFYEKKRRTTTGASSAVVVAQESAAAQDKDHQHYCRHATKRRKAIVVVGAVSSTTGPALLAVTPGAADVKPTTLHGSRRLITSASHEEGPGTGRTCAAADRGRVNLSTSLARTCARKHPPAAEPSGY